MAGDVRTAVRVRRRDGGRVVRFEVRVWVGQWAGGWVSVGYWAEADVAAMVGRAVRNRLGESDGQLTPLGVWQTAVTGMGFAGEIGERLRGLLPKWVQRIGEGGFRHSVTRLCAIYPTAEAAHRAALLLWWPREYRRVAERMALKLLAEPPSFEDVARRMNAVGMRTSGGELWTRAAVKDLVRRRRRRRGRVAESAGQAAGEVA